MRLTPAIEYLFPTHSPAWEDNSDDQPRTSALNDSRLSDTLLSPHRSAPSENEVPTVLVVDDEDDVRRLVVTALGRAGYRVLQAANGESALYLAQEHAPDLIVLDLMMPGMDGLELCRQLRDDVCLSTVPVVMLTAKDRPRDMLEGLDAGASDYLTKPFSLRELMNLVEQYT